MRSGKLVAFMVAVGVVAGSDAATVGERHTVEHHGGERGFLAYEPADLAGTPPVLVLLHGSGRDGESLLEPWRGLADAEGILLVAPEFHDPFFPLNPVRATRDLLAEHGCEVELVEIPHHDHDYYRRAKKVNAAAWAFFERVLARPAASAD